MSMRKIWRRLIRWPVCLNKQKLITGNRKMKIFLGTVIHSTKLEPVCILKNAAIGVDGAKIVFVGNKDSSEVKDESNTVITLDDGEFLIPGLIDTHIHASQYVNCGKALDLPLLQWLETYTFPAESKFSDVTYAKHVYNKVVRRLLRNGTTTACYFATIHTQSTLELCNVIENYGQRAYVGKVCMDCNCSKELMETLEESTRETEIFVNSLLQRKNDLISPVITPRFAISCTSALLKKLGEIAKEHDLPIQSHLSENKSEVDWIKELHPDHKHYCDVYDKHGLFNEKTIMAHAVHLSDEEVQHVKDRGVGISHCPNSNISICSGLCDVRRLLDMGVKVGLGTDVAAGYQPSILDAIRQTVQMSKTLSILSKDENYQPLNFRQAFRLATLGGAEVLGMADKIGNFVLGKDFDALIINTKTLDSPFDVFDSDSDVDLLDKFLCSGDERNIRRVYVAGRDVTITIPKS